LKLNASISQAALVCLSIFSSALQAQITPPKNEYTFMTTETLEPAFNCWMDAYQQAHPDFKSTRVTTRNAEVVKGLIDGKTPIAPCTREMTSQELNEFSAKWGYAPTRIGVCMDALAVLVNRNNPIKFIRIEQVDAIFSASRNQGWPKSIDSWGELGLTGENWSSRPIIRYGHPEGSGTRAFFREAVELNGSSKPDTRHGEDIQQMIEAIMASQATIGYGSFTQAHSQLKAVPLIPKGGKAPIEPTPIDIANGSYPLGRVLYVYVNKPSNKRLEPSLQSFLAYILSKDGQRCVVNSGFVALPEEFVSMGLSRLER